MYAVENVVHESLAIHINILNYLIDEGVDTEHEQPLHTLCEIYNVEEMYASIIARLQGNQDDKLTKSEDESQKIVSNEPFVRANARTHL